MIKFYNLRGGSWFNDKIYCWIMDRNWGMPNHYSYHITFRLIKKQKHE